MEWSQLILFTALIVSCLSTFIAWHYHRIYKQLIDQQTTLQEQADSEKEAKFDAIKAKELALQEVNLLKAQMKEWESLKETSLQHAKAAVSKVGADLSSKLLEDHKREAEANRKENEDRITKTTKNLHQQLEKLVGNMASQHDRLSKCETTTQTVWQALSSPIDVGQSSEIGMKNTFESFGLEQNRDFFLQYHLAENEQSNRLRPDAVSFIGNNVLVIDSKASTFFLEYAAAKDTEHEQQALQSLKKSMNHHLSSLVTKGYRDAVAKQIQQDFNQTGRTGIVNQTYMVMYVPNDSAIETLYKADPGFSQKMIHSDIILAGPSVLKGLMMILHFHDVDHKRLENHEAIITEVKHLLGNIATLQHHTEGMGKGIKRAFDSYDKLAGSFNRSLLSTIRKMHDLGVTQSKSKSLPTQLPRYQIVTNMIEAENSNESVESTKKLENIDS